MGINRQKQIAQAKLESNTDAEFQAKLLTMLLQAGDYTNEQLISLITDNKKTIEKSLELARAVQGFVASLKDKEIQTIINLPKTVSIENAIDLIEPKWLGKLATDTKAIETKLADIIKAIQDKEVAKQVEVINEVKVAEPRWYKPFDAATFGNKLILGIKDAFRDVLKGVIVKVTSEYPLRVVLTNSAGKPIDTKSLGGGAAVVYGGGGGGGSSSTGGNVGVLNAADARINPATTEGQADIVAAINSITVPAPVGAATEATLDNLRDNVGATTDASPAAADDPATLLARMRALLVYTYQMMADIGDTKATVNLIRTELGVYDTNTKKVDAKSRITLASFPISSTTTTDLITPTTGYKLRIYSLQFSSDITLTAAEVRPGAAGASFWKQLTAKAGGLYGFNLGDKYHELATDELLTIIINNDVAYTGNVQVNVAYEEVA